MPELPEVESLRIGLVRVLVGQKILKATVRKPKIISQKKSKFSVFDWESCQMKSQEIFETELVGQEFVKIKRRAKNLILEFKSGDILLVHLKMTGQLVFKSGNLMENSSFNLEKQVKNKTKTKTFLDTSLQNARANKENLEWENLENDEKQTETFSKNEGKNQLKIESNSQSDLEIESERKAIRIVAGGHPIEVMELPNKHTHVIFELTDGFLFYNDIRQFGYVRFFRKGEFDEEKHFEKLGMEPLSEHFELEEFAKSMAKLKSGILKKVFLDQKIVVGLGNIYCDEVCFAARILPTRNVTTLTKAEIERLFIEIQRIMPLAVKHGGSSIANYLLVDGKRGNFADFHLVYGKYGKLCSVCDNVLQKTKISGRTTTFCSICQT